MAAKYFKNVFRLDTNCYIKANILQRSRYKIRKTGEKETFVKISGSPWRQQLWL